ncbi:NlpC/P60 family protein [Polynucleobacter sp. AP-RePozz3-80-G7]|uniref:NlpC/P60 family protein n=1 Tax=Polynucleobacter sp. AP-RePozz3-80-G7 TaxID=2689105 RepID=UPI001C0B4733|nr:NlpC/P60 family protein [Polynucleobacter sp. AP-RePozz3-80-G7]MBU3640021.1 C40 family peptidase [Polynucleobacter sp. AP-RePozz3-80-G7]
MNAILKEAYSWMGTPYHVHGRIKGAGVDCATLLCEVYETVGLIPHVDPGYYTPDWHLHRAEEKYLGWLYQYGTEIDKPEPGDVAIWKIGRCFSHGAIVVNETTIIHSHLGQGVVLADIQQFGNRAVKFFRVGK